MKRTFKLSTGVFGEGDPKICAPIVGRTKEDVFKAAEVIAKAEADVVEWRGDWFDRVEDRDELFEVLQGIRGRIREKALIFTLRTVYEGGQLAVMKDTYYELNERAARSGYVDLVGVEAFREEERAGFKKGFAGWPLLPYSRMVAILALLSPSDLGSEKPTFTLKSPFLSCRAGDVPRERRSSPVLLDSYFVPLPMTACRLERTLSSTISAPASSTFGRISSVLSASRDTFIRKSSGIFI